MPLDQSHLDLIFLLRYGVDKFSDSLTPILNLTSIAKLLKMSCSTVSSHLHKSVELKQKGAVYVKTSRSKLR